MTKPKVAIISAIFVLVVATAFVLQQLTRLHREKVGLEKQLEGPAELRVKNAHLSNQIAQADNAQSLARNQMSELLRLRSEVGLLRQQTNQLAALQEICNCEKLTRNFAKPDGFRSPSNICRHSRMSLPEVASSQR
jgi:hypothetical protein